MSTTRSPLHAGTRLAWISWGVHPENGDVLALVRAGEHGCAEIIVGHEAGPMGFFAVAIQISDAGDETRHPLHLLTSYQLAK